MIEALLVVTLVPLLTAAAFGYILWKAFYRDEGE